MMELSVFLCHVRTPAQGENERRRCCSAKLIQNLLLEIPNRNKRPVALVLGYKRWLIINDSPTDLEPSCCDWHYLSQKTPYGLLVTGWPNVRRRKRCELLFPEVTPTKNFSRKIDDVDGWLTLDGPIYWHQCRENGDRLPAPII